MGLGSFAKVSRVRRRSTDEVFVWKELSYGVMSKKGKQMLCDEVNILRDLKHPNIVQFVDRIIDHSQRRIYIVQEYCNGGDLASYIAAKKEKNGRVAETFIWSVTCEIASALQHCHNNHKPKAKEKQRSKSKREKKQRRRILHRDLKPGNVFLVKRGGSYSVKLGDFGLAKSLDESSVFAQSHVGTPYYMSPEQIQNKEYNEKSDMWSLGCIVYEMAMLSPPFRAQNYLELAIVIKGGKYTRVATRDYSAELEECVAMMLAVDTERRAAVEELLCVPRVRFTCKMLHLDRRYTQLKRKEQELANKNKAMLQKEQQLKDREEAVRKREEALTLKQTQALTLHSAVSAPAPAEAVSGPQSPPADCKGRSFLMIHKQSQCRGELEVEQEQKDESPTATEKHIYNQSIQHSLSAYSLRERDCNKSSLNTQPNKMLMSEARKFLLRKDLSMQSQILLQGRRRSVPSFDAHFGGLSVTSKEWNAKRALEALRK